MAHWYALPFPSGLLPKWTNKGKEIDMQITVNAGSKTPIYKQIVNQIKDMVLRTELTEGARLPSERILAESIGVHRNTIIRAYGELKAEGFIDAVRGVGYRVAFQSESQEGDAEPPAANRNNQLFWPALIKEELWDANSQVDGFVSKLFDVPAGISFSCGLLSPEARPYESILGMVEELLSQAQASGQPICQGGQELRHSLSKFLRRKSIYANASEIAILSDAHQVLECLIEMMISPGDVVILEEPNYPNLYRQFKRAGATIITVPGDADGMMTNLLEPIIQKYQPKLVYTTGGFHDPTGRAMSSERRRILLDLACKYQFPIIEDDWTSGLSFENNLLSLKAMDTANHVIYIYSFVFTFAEGVRVSLVSAAKEVIERLNYLLSVKSFRADDISQTLLSRCLDNGTYQDTLQKMTACCQRKCDLMCECLEQAKPLGVSYERPQGGIFLWCRLPQQISLNKMLKLAQEHNISIIPGDVFYLNGTKGEQHLRLNFSYPSESQIVEGVAALVRIMKESMNGA